MNTIFAGVNQFRVFSTIVLAGAVMLSNRESNMDLFDWPLDSILMIKSTEILAIQLKESGSALSTNNGNT